MAGVYGAADRGPYELFRALHRSLVLGHLSGRWDAAPGGPLGYAAQDPFEMPFDEAVKWFQARKVVTPEEFAELSQSSAERAFRVAGVTDRRVLDAMHSSLGKAIEDGGTLQEWVNELDDKLDRLGVEPFDLHQLDVIFQNAVADAYAGGRYEQMKRTSDARPYWRYGTARDQRVRPAHAAMEGFIARHDDPVWEIWYPPNGHRCRCDVESLTADEVADHLFGPPPGDAPDVGWARSPARAGAADDLGREMRGAEVDAPLAGLSVPPGRIGRMPRRDMDAQHATAMAGLDQGADAARLRAIRARLGVSTGEVVELLEQVEELALQPELLVAPSTGVVLELAVPVQNRLALEDTLRRLAYAGHAPRVTQRWRARAVRGRSGPVLPVEVLDAELGQRLGDEVAVRWTSDVVLRMELAGSADEITTLVLAQAQRSGSGPALPFAPDFADITALGPEATTLAGMEPATLFWRGLKEGGTASVPATHILPGWEPISVALPLLEP